LSDGRPAVALLNGLAPRPREVCAYAAMVKDGKDPELFVKARWVEVRARIVIENNTALVPICIKIACNNII
jgi:hypothetical protein